MVLTVSFALSPGTGLCCPRRLRDAKHHRKLDLSVGRPGPYDFAVRACHVRLACHPRPPHPRPTCRDDRAYVPLHRGGMRGTMVVICPTRQAVRRAADWHDGQFAHGGCAGIAGPTSGKSAAVTAEIPSGRQIGIIGSCVWLMPLGRKLQHSTAPMHRQIKSKRATNAVPDSEQCRSSG
jgi:hypothetical protein